MKKKISLTVFSFFTLILLSCPGQRKNIPLVIIPDNKTSAEINYSIGVDDIIETKNGPGNAGLPEWLFVFNDGGTTAVEKMEQYYGKYCFIGRIKGVNFEALTKWADNFLEARAFTRLAAVRIENRLISSAVLYPDDEYGVFFEKFIKKTYDVEYPNTSIEDIFWIKKAGNEEANEPQDAYEFFAFVSIDKATMQDVINKMIAETLASVTPTRAQSNAINNVQLHFFEGF